MLNKVILIGRLTKDPEIRVTTSGFSVGTFSLAVNRSFASSNGEKETDFFNCVCFRNLAEIVGRYVKKGQLISVEGRIQNRSYDAQDGTKRYITEIVCDNVVFLESSRSQNDNNYGNNNYSNNNYSNNNNNNNNYQQQQSTFNVNREQPRFNNNTQSNNRQQPKDNYFDDNPNVDISEDDLPF
jgi:single-strand DNA-binding protein